MSKLAEILSPLARWPASTSTNSLRKGGYSSFQKRSFCVFRLFCVFLGKKLFFLVHSAINFRSPPPLLYLPFFLPPPSYLAICMKIEVSPHLSHTVSLRFFLTPSTMFLHPAKKTDEAVAIFFRPQRPRGGEPATTSFAILRYPENPILFHCTFSGGRNNCRHHSVAIFLTNEHLSSLQKKLAKKGNYSL